MKRLVIIAEGETEESFVNKVLCPYLLEEHIYNNVQCFKTKHSGGGLSKYSLIKKDVLNVIYETDVLVTTMIDYYRLPPDFPYFDEAKKLTSHFDQVSIIESKIKEDIEKEKNRLFDNLKPYIQLHEFEALIFSSTSGIGSLFETNEYNKDEFESIVREFPNPEDINNRPDTAPSVRLKGIIPGYNKVLYGIDIIQSIGMKTLLEKCPHFNNWIKMIINELR